MTARGWLELLVDQADLPELEAHRRSLLAAGVDEAVADAETRAAVEVAQLLRERRQRAVELSALNDVARRLAAVVDPADLLVEVVDQARRLLGVDLTYVALLRGDDLRIEVASGDRSSRLVGISLPRHAGLVGSVVTRGTPRWTSDYAVDDDLEHEEGADRAAAAESIRGLLGVPLAVRGRVLGVLLAAKREERRFGEHEIGLLTGLAAHAAVALDNAGTARELRDAKDELEATLRLDADLTRAVLAGGDPASLVERLRVVTDVPVRWAGHPGEGAVGEALAAVERDAVAAGRSGRVPGRASASAPGSALGPAPRPVGGPVVVGTSVVQPVTAAGQLLGGLVVDGVASSPGARAAGAEGDRLGDGSGAGAGTAPPEVLLLLERAAPLIALTLVGSRATARADQLGRDIATIDLLSRAEPDEAADRRRWRGAGLDPRRAHAVVVVGGDPAVARRWAAGLGLGDRVATATLAGRFVLVVPDADDLEARWTGEGAPAAGLAGPVVDPAGLRDAYAEADRTARALTALGRRGGLARAADLGVFAVLLSRTGRRDLEEQTARELGVVLTEEAARGVPLVATLEAYLEQGRRPRATATALRVHVNTVYQRLATLDGLLGDGWRDRSLELQVLLRLRRVARAVDGA